MRALPTNKILGMLWPCLVLLAVSFILICFVGIDQGRLYPVYGIRWLMGKLQKRCSRGGNQSYTRKYITVSRDEENSLQPKDIVSEIKRNCLNRIKAETRRKCRNFEDTKGGRCLKNYFQDVLLIVVYHYPFYRTIPFIKSHYKDAFPHITVCGPRKSEHFDILQVDFGPGGYYSYECLGKAIRLHPGYRGYLFVNDDMVVNWWNFAKLDKDKIWQGAQVSYRIGHELGRRPIPDDWMWWIKGNGSINCENAYKEVVGLASDTVGNVEIKKLLAIHFRNGRNKTMCFRTWSDFVYIPGNLSREFEVLSRIFFKNKVFLEIAFPTITSFLDDWDAWEKVYGIYLPEVYGFQDFSNVKYVWPKFSENVPFLHPVKFFGDKGLRNRKIFEKRVRFYGKRFTLC